MNKFTKVLLSLPLLLGTVACSSSSFSVKSTQGYTFEFQKDNITTEIVKETKTGGGMFDWGHYWITKVGDTYGPSADDVYVTANGTWTDLVGNTSHFSEKVLCKSEAYVLYGREGAGPQKHNRPAHMGEGARFDGRSMNIEARYQNENSVVCQAARHYNLI